MATFGHQLKRTREQRGVSLDDIARETRLSKRYLVALEDEAIAKLPGGAYNRAYLKTYAGFLGLDPHPLLREYVEEETRHTQNAEQDQLAAMNRVLERRGTMLPQHAASNGSDQAAGTRRFILAAVSLATLAVIGGAAWFGLSGFQRASSTLEVTGVERASQPAADQALRTDPTPPALTTEGIAARAPISDAIPASRTTSTSHLTLAGSGVGTNVADRRLVGESDRFAAGSRVVFWTHIRGGRAGDTIDHVWFRQGALVGAASLPVGSDDWRTQSLRQLDPPGAWAVEARDAEGHVLARHEFQTATP